MAQRSANKTKVRRSAKSTAPAKAAKKPRSGAPKANRPANAAPADRKGRSAKGGNKAASAVRPVRLVPTGIEGLDQVLGGGLPKGRAMLITGGAGTGKTIIGMEFLLHGGTEHDEPGVLVSFEESADELAANAAGFGWDVASLKDDGRLYPLSIDVGGAAGAVETGEFDLEALFMRIDAAIRRVGAKRIVLDGINNLLAAFENEQIVRSELLRLFRWLKEKGLTIVATGEAGNETWTRLGFEEYLADGVIVLSHRVEGKVAKRSLRVIKCRGIAHSTNEYPFLIAKDGISLFPINATDLDFDVLTDFVPTGIAGLDEMLDGKGVFRGSNVLVSGCAGTGKSSLCASFVDAVCRRGEGALYVAFEESPEQIIRNMRSIGIDLGKWRKKGLLTFHATRPMRHGVEGHLTAIQELISQTNPRAAVIDPVSSLLPIGTETEVKSVLTLMVDYLRLHGITTIMTNLAQGGASGEEAEFAISSMADTWILVHVLEQNAERSHVIKVLKSRGMNHSRVVRELNFTPDGLDIVNAYIGKDGDVIVGSAREEAEALDEIARKREVESGRM